MDGRSQAGKKTEDDFSKFSKQVVAAILAALDGLGIAMIEIDEGKQPIIWGKSNYDPKVHPLLVRATQTAVATSETSAQFHLDYWDGRLKGNQLKPIIENAIEAKDMARWFAGRQTEGKSEQGKRKTQGDELETLRAKKRKVSNKEKGTSSSTVKNLTLAVAKTKNTDNAEKGKKNVQATHMRAAQAGKAAKAAGAVVRGDMASASVASEGRKEIMSELKKKFMEKKKPREKNKSTGESSWSKKG